MLKTMMAITFIVLYSVLMPQYVIASSPAIPLQQQRDQEQQMCYYASPCPGNNDDVNGSSESVVAGIQTNAPVMSMVGMQTIMEFCLKDERCSELYGQVPWKGDLSVFTHLYNTFIVSADMPYDFSTVDQPLLVGITNRSEAEILAFLWILILRYNAADSNICSVNERFILTDPEAGVGGCVCMPDRTCYYDDSLSSILIALTFIIIFMLLSVIAISVTDLGQYIKSLAESVDNPRRQIPASASGTSSSTKKGF